MFIIRPSFLNVHRVIFQLLASLSKSGSSSIRTNSSVFQVLHPFIQRSSSHLIKLVYADKNVFRENFGGHTGNDGITLLNIYLQLVTGMYTYKVILPMVQEIASLSYVKVEDTDGVDFLHLIVSITQRDMFGDSLCHSIKDTFQIIEFAGILYFDDDNLVLTVACLDVNTVELVIGSLLISFTFQYFDNRDFFTQKYSKETFKHTKIGLLPQ